MNITPVNYSFKNLNFTSNNCSDRPKTIAILGSSKTTDSILDSMELCSQVTKNIILNGNNILTGCGNSGIMGAAYESGKKYSIKDENNKPIQNQAIVMQPMWGDEDLDNCVVKSYSNSENERIEQIRELSDKILVFPGSATTLLETTSLIQQNYYSNPEDKKEVILVGKDFFKGLYEQYNELYKQGLIKCPPEELFSVVDNENEINEKIDK